MKLTKTLIASALTLAMLPALAGEMRLLPAGSKDTVVHALADAGLKRGAAHETEPVHFAWRLDPTQPLQAVQESHRAQSKEYWDTRSADDMAKGVAISTTAAGAIVRLSPAVGSAQKTISARELILSKDGRSYANGSGMETLSDGEDLLKSGVPFVEGSAIFRIDPELGAGRFELQLPQAAGEVVVHVFEPASTLSLELQANRGSFLRGMPIEIEAALVDGQAKRGVDLLRGAITSPGGQMREFAFAADKRGGYRAQLDAAFEPEQAQGLWEIHAFASAETETGRVLRDARTAFAFAEPTARLTGSARNVPVRMREPVVFIEFDVEVAVSGRYQLGGVLYGTAADGSTLPVAIAQTAQLLEPGVHGMTLMYGPDVLDDAAVGAPWQVRDLQLVDQVSMGLLEQRERALDFRKD